MAPPLETDFRDVAMGALKNLVNNVPDWLKRLDDLSGQIDRRQAELAAVAASEGKSAETKSLRNKGSTESPKPKDDTPVAHTEAPANEDILQDGRGDNTTQTPVKPETPKVHTPNPALIAKKKQFDKLVVRQDVYYDNYGLSFFDEILKFISSNENQLHKLRIAARVARVKKLAAQDVSEDGSDLTSRLDSKNQPPDVYNDLRKYLESMEDMCEDGAKQLLRKGHCSKKIKQIHEGLTEVLEMAKTEMERVEREEPELAKETGEIGKVRTRRPISMRRDMAVGLKESSPTPTKEENKLEPAKLEAAEPIIPADPMAPMAVDPNIMEADEGIDVEMELPKLHYRSTRAMRSRGP